MEKTLPLVECSIYQIYLESQEAKTYMIPIYQRNYAWEEDEITALIKDVYDSFHKNPKAIYYIGTLVTYKRGDSEYEVIDGQQRIATYSLMFLALYSLYKTNKIKDLNSQFSSLENSQLWKNDGQTRNRKLRLITLNSLDKDFFEKIFDKAFDEPKKLKTFIEKYNCSSTAENRIKENFLMIYDFYESNLFTQNGIQNNEPQMYLNFLLNQVQMIGIRTSLSKQKIFEMFESINSKFKPLDEIDLIKTYVFKSIDETEYDSMLSRWSDLIKGTDDNLQDYLKIYARSFIYYYSTDIKIKTFSSSLISSIKEQHSLKTDKEAVCKLVEELERWLPSYQKLIFIDDALKEIKSSEFETYYRIFNMLNYEHPKPLIFKAFCLLQDNKISEDEVTKTLKMCTLYMLTFKSIMNQDSKSSIKVFGEICDIFRNGSFDVTTITNKLNESMANKSITIESSINTLQSTDLYDKPISFPILALLQSIDIKSDKDRSGLNDEQIYAISELDYDMAITYLQQYKRNIFHVDHIMHQTPDQSSKLKYRCIRKKFGNESLQLLPGHDFPKEINGVAIQDDMSYKTFKVLTINRLGNLRLITKHTHLKRKNKGIYLDSNATFESYSKMNKRGSKLSNYFFKCPSLMIK